MKAPCAHIGAPSVRWSCAGLPYFGGLTRLGRAVDLLLRLHSSLFNVALCHNLPRSQFVSEDVSLALAHKYWLSLEIVGQGGQGATNRTHEGVADVSAQVAAISIL